MRLQTYDQPCDRDVATYAVIAHELNSGKQLYTQIWDHKPPAIYWTYALAERLSGYGWQSIFLLGLAAAAGTLLSVYYAGSSLAGRSGPGRERTANGTISAILPGAFAAAVWAVSANDLALAAGQPNTEVFINLLIATAFALWVAPPKCMSFRSVALSVGSLFALASLYKPVCLPVLALLCLAHFLTAGGRMNFKQWLPRTAVDAALFALPVLASWLLVLLLFAVTGARKAFVGAIFTYNQFYSGNLFHNLARALNPDILIHPALQFCWPLFALCLTAAIAGMFTQNRRQWSMLLAYMAGTFIAVLVPGQYFEHYYQLWLPPLAIGAGWSLKLLGDLSGRSISWLSPLLGLCVLASLLSHEWPVIGSNNQDWKTKYFTSHLIEAKQLGQQLGATLAPGENFYEWGAETELYFYSGKRPVTTVLFNKHIFEGPFCERFEKLTVAELEKSRPKLLIICTDYLHPGCERDQVLSWCRAHYKPLETQPAYSHYSLWTLAERN